MEKGKYYIGDLCYVIKGDNWDEVCSLTYPYTGKNVHKQVEGEFFLEDGRQFCIFSTLYGDGVYYSCLLYTSPSPRDKRQSRMPSSA